MRACENPFASHRIEALRYRLSDAEWARLLARLDQFGGRGSVIGRHGSGKTTLLEELGARLADRGLVVRLVRLDGCGPSGPGGPAASHGEAMLVDGADRLGPLAWRWLRVRARKAAVLVVTSHREGRLPTLHRCSTSPALLSGLVAELVGGPPERHRELAEVLHLRHGGDVRAALRELYDREGEDSTRLS